MASPPSGGLSPTQRVSRFHFEDSHTPRSEDYISSEEEEAPSPDELGGAAATSSSRDTNTRRDRIAAQRAENSTRDSHAAAEIERLEAKLAAMQREMHDALKEANDKAARETEEAQAKMDVAVATARVRADRADMEAAEVKKKARTLEEVVTMAQGEAVAAATSAEARIQETRRMVLAETAAALEKAAVEKATTIAQITQAANNAVAVARGGRETYAAESVMAVAIAERKAE